VCLFFLQTVFSLLHVNVNGKVKKVVFVVQRYAVRIAKKVKKLKEIRGTHTGGVLVDPEFYLTGGVELGGG